MVEQLKIKIARWLTKGYIQSLDTAHAKAMLDIDMQVNQRVAKMISEMDPFEPLMKQFHGVFSEQYEHPEQRLDTPSRMRMYMWGWQQETDPHFHHLMNWIMNTQGNETLRHAPVTPERILYGRAQLSCMLLFKNEVARLSNLYLEEKARMENGDFDPTLTVDE